MPEIPDIKPTGPTWQKRPIDPGRPRPERRRREDEPEDRPAEDGDDPRDGRIDEYA